MKVSIIITCYNYGVYLKDALKSVLDLDFDKDSYEVIIVDDGSTDPVTQYIVDDIAKKNIKNVLVFKKQNGGVASARNFGFEKSSGDYILFLDADDKLHKDYLNKTVKILDDKQATSFVYTNSIFFNDKKSTKIFNLKYNFYSLLFRNYIPVTSLIRRNDFAAIGGYKNCSYEDWELYINLGKNNFKGFLLNKYLFFYRVHGGSKQLGDDLKKQKNIQEIKDIHNDIYNKNVLVELQKKSFKNKINFYFYEIFRLIRALIINFRKKKIY